MAHIGQKLPFAAGGQLSLVARLLQGAHVVLALGNVPRSAEQQLIATDLHANHIHFNVENMAIAVAVLGLKCLGFAHQSQHSPTQLFWFWRPHCVPLRHIHTDHFLRRIAQHAAERSVHLYQLAMQVNHMDAVTRRLEQAFIFLALRQ